MKKHFCDLMNGYKVLFLFLVQYRLTGAFFSIQILIEKAENLVRYSLRRGRGESAISHLFFRRLASQHFFCQEMADS